MVCLLRVTNFGDVNADTAEIQLDDSVWFFSPFFIGNISRFYSRLLFVFYLNSIFENWMQNVYLRLPIPVSNKGMKLAKKKETNV